MLKDLPDQVCWSFSDSSSWLFLAPLDSGLNLPVQGGQMCSSRGAMTWLFNGCSVEITSSMKSRRHFSHHLLPQTQRAGSFHQGALLSLNLSHGHTLPLMTKAVRCLSDDRSRKLDSTLTRSLSTWRRQRNSTVSFCLHQFQSLVSVYLGLSHPAMAFGTGAEPVLFFLPSVNSRGVYICITFHRRARHLIPHSPVSCLRSPRPATGSSCLHSPA